MYCMARLVVLLSDITLRPNLSTRFVRGLKASKYSNNFLQISCTSSSDNNFHSGITDLMVGIIAPQYQPLISPETRFLDNSIRISLFSFSQNSRKSRKRF